MLHGGKVMLEKVEKFRVEKNAPRLRSVTVLFNPELFNFLLLFNIKEIKQGIDYPFNILIVVFVSFFLRGINAPLVFTA